MIGLGVGIDYALFIVTRHKLQLGEGMELRESIARATATAGGAVVFAGFTVVIALCSLAFAGIPLVSHARLHRRGRGRRRRLRRGDAAAGDARRARPAHQLAAGPARQDPPGRQRAARLAALGASGSPSRPWRSALAALRRSSSSWRCRSSSSSSGQNDISALPKDTTSRQAYDSAQQGLRARRQRAAADRLRIQLAGRSETGAAEPAESDRRRRRRRRGRRTDARQSGDGGGLHGDLEIGAVGGRDRRPGRRPARRRRSRRR